MSRGCPEWKKTLPEFAHHLSGGEWEPYPHLTYLSEQITDEIAEGDGRIIVNMPPRHGKSELCSHWLPVMFMEAYPELLTIITSYEADFAKEWGRKVRDEFNGPELWTNPRQDVRAANRWKTPEGGGLVTAGIGGSVTGRGGHLIILDDPYKNWRDAHSPAYRRHLEEWFLSTLYTRKEPGASIVVIHTRWHEDDLTGYLMNTHKDDWKQIVLPAIAEENDPMGREVGEPLCPMRYTLEDLKAIEAGTGPLVWAGMYQQRPMKQGGTVFKGDWFKYWDEMPKSFDRMIQSWDMTFKKTESGSYVTGQVWGAIGPDYYLLDQFRERVDFVQTIHEVLTMTKRWPEAKAKLIEDKANGPAVMSTLEDKIAGIISISPQGSKEARAHSVSPLFKAGNVYIPNPTLFPWVSEYMTEMTTFPSAKRDDQVDTTSQALSYLDDRTVAAIGKLELPNLTRRSPWSMVS